MAKYLVTVQYDDSTVYRRYEIETESSEEWLENNLDHIETKGEIWDDDVDLGPASIFDIEKQEES